MFVKMLQRVLQIMSIILLIRLALLLLTIVIYRRDLRSPRTHNQRERKDFLDKCDHLKALDAPTALTCGSMNDQSVEPLHVAPRPNRCRSIICESKYLGRKEEEILNNFCLLKISHQHFPKSIQDSTTLSIFPNHNDIHVIEKHIWH